MMKKIAHFAACCSLLLCFDLSSMGQEALGTTSREEFLTQGMRSADAQIQALNGKAVIDWVGAVMWTGMMDLHAAGAPGKERILQALLEAGKKVNWTPLLNPKDPFFADDYCFGQAILDAYALAKDQVDLKPLRLRVESLAPYLEATANRPKLLTWSWCDALFMGPAVQARWAEMSGEPRFLDTMNTEWWKVSSVLYDSENHLYYRDDRFLPAKKLTKNGKKVFWSRGNGWVVMGLTRVLDHLPSGYPDRPKYEAQFKEMAERLISLQQPDGTWPSSLLDPVETPSSEFSGTAFFCAGMAWGINHGLLDRTKYLPVVTRAWAALLAMRRADGLPGHVQAVGDAPSKVSPEGTQLYATGGFCMAAAQLSKLAPLELPPSPALTSAVPSTP